MNNRKLGRARISCDMIDREPNRVAEVFSLLKFVPVRAECLHYSDEIEYVAISERFATVPFGQIIPEYNLKITQDEDGRVNLVEVEQITSGST